MKSVVNLICTHCGASIDVNSNHLKTYCPFCSSELMINMEQFEDIVENNVKLGFRNRWKPVGIALIILDAFLSGALIYLIKMFIM